MTEMLSKALLKNALKSFPEQFTIEELVERLIILDKIEQGLADSAAGNVLSEPKMDEEMKKWFK